MTTDFEDTQPMELNSQPPITEIPGGGPTPAPPPTLHEEIPGGEGTQPPSVDGSHKVTVKLNSNGSIVLDAEGSVPLTVTPEQLHALFLQANIDSEPRKATALEGQATALSSQAQAANKQAQMLERLVEGDIGYAQPTDEQVVLSLLYAQAQANIHGVVAMSNANKTLVPFRAKYPLKT